MFYIVATILLALAYVASAADSPSGYLIRLSFLLTCVWGVYNTLLWAGVIITLNPAYGL